MNLNSVYKISFYKGRDVSPFLFHFVKGDNPLRVLEQILKDNALKSKKYDFISYTESPLRVMKDVLDYFQTFKGNPGCIPMFEHYGIGLKKDQMFLKYNARPVIYGTEDEKDKFDKSLQWRFEKLDFESRNFSWQREWRTKGNYFELPEDDEDVIIICRYEKEAERLKEQYSHPCISFEYIEDNHASDYIADSYACLQLMSEFEIECFRQEGEEIRQKHQK
ncbi:MAG: hypothetical protein K5899_00875 [Bacteroidaceae bacterium]|nr:hypothetical protein [Bacteroidaceae bacterium]